MLRLVAVVTVMACLALTTVAVARDATWSIRYPPTDGLESVSCTSPEACTAVGGGFGPFAARWDGLRWHYERVIDPASPNAMNPSKLCNAACTSSIACIAVGEYDKDRCGPSYGGCQAATLPIAERWNGARWTLQSTRTSRGTGFSTNWTPSPVQGRGCAWRSAHEEGSSSTVQCGDGQYSCA